MPITAKQRACQLLFKDGRPAKDKHGPPMYKREYAENSCYLVAHRKVWKKNLLEHQAEVISKIKKANKKYEQAKKKRNKQKKKSKKR